MHIPHCNVQLFVFYGFLLSGGVLTSGEHSHGRGVSRRSVGFRGVMPAGPFAEEMEITKFDYEKCMGELRRQAEAIQRLHNLTDTQTAMIHELQATVSQHQKKIEQIEFSLERATSTNSFSLKPASTDRVTGPETLNASLNHTQRGGIVFRSCDEIRSFQSSQSGSYWIDPDGHGGDGAIHVFCNMSNGATLISHDAEDMVEVTSCTGCSNRTVNYRNTTLKQLTTLARTATTCYQQLKYDSCTEESLTRKRTYSTAVVGSSWWKNRDGLLRYDWPVKSMNDSDGNFITNRHDLPVIQFHFGREYGVSGLCSSRFQMGKLICLGRSRGKFQRRHANAEPIKIQEFSGNAKVFEHRISSPIETGVVSGDHVRQPSLGCTFDLHSSSPQYPPHLIDENNNIIQPILQGRSRIITLNVDDEVTVGCLGISHDRPSTNILKATGMQMNRASCTANSTLRFDQMEFSYSQLGCAYQNKEVLKEEGSCANGRGIQIRIGWNLGSDFIRLYDTCHDQIASANYYSTHTIIGRSVDADDKSNKRPSFRQAGYYPGVDVNAAFSQAQQNKTIARVVGADTLVAKYLNQKKNLFLARGHLAPDGDFIDAGSQDATYYYLNMAPQWQSFNGGNWNILEVAVRQIAITRDLDLTVYTGTFGTTTLTDVNGKQQPLYLTFDKNNNGVIPVPKYYWKLIHDPLSGTATAVLGINNPHLDRVLPTDILCENVCNQIPWVNWKLTDISKGYMFCCTAEELHQAIPFAPNLIAPLFL